MKKWKSFLSFLRKSKPNFPFEDIAKRIAGKGNYSYYKDENDFPYVFNYPMYQSVSGCPTTAQLIDIFGANWVDTIKNSYVGAGNKNDEQIINDIWHVLRTFTDEDKLVAFGKCKLGLSGDDALKFSKISMRDDYASLSLNAINKILPYLRDGLLYSHSVFLANMGKVVPAEVWNSLHDRKIIIEEVVHIVNTFSEDDIKNKRTIEGNIGDFLSNNFNLSNGALDKLYHPSMIDTYPDTLPDEKGIKMLGSPRTDAIRNPMAMRAFFRLRALVNALIKEGKIDSATKVNIEFARELNDANKRKAIERYQRDREAERKQYVLAICEHLPGYEPSEDDLLKYRLWEEQNHKCLYTGKEIALTDFIGANPKFDIEHTIPRSSGGDDSIENKTLCDSHFNRDKKGTKIPSQLDNHSDIMARIGKWKDKYEQLDKEIDVQVSRSKRAATKEAKDAAMQQKHYLIMQRNYWRSKYGRFEMAEVPSGFKNSQGVDNSIIAKYGRLYLKTVFPRTYTVKGLATADFRKLWGLQDEYAKKERVNHVHHCIDAITIACIGRKDYDYMAHYFFDLERYRNCQSGNKPEYPKPWPTFTEDVKNIDNSVLVSHYTPDNLSKQSKRKLRVKGKIQYDTDGNPKYEQGDTVRGELHQSTFYGAIMRNDELKYVVRKNLGDLKESDVAKIVDDVVKEKIQKAIVEKGFKKATSEPVWMNEGKGVQIKKVRCFTPSIVKPIHLKKQRDLSKHDYKQDYYVANDNNYCMAIYEGLDCDGKLKRDFAIINNLDAAKFYKKKRNNPQEKLFNEKSKNGFPLKYILKKGTMVLFWEKDPSEIWSLSKEELKNRLYKVIGMTTLIVQNKYSYGMLDLKYHQEARIKGELNPKKGLWLSNEKYRPLITINHNQFNAIVQGYDFEFSVTGEITPIKR
jgi:CRISPR-associated endonuclease Csn1